MGVRMPGGLSVVAYRAKGVRLRCDRCGLRLTLDAGQVFRILDGFGPDDGDREFQKAMAVSAYTRHMVAS